MVPYNGNVKEILGHGWGRTVESIERTEASFELKRQMSWVWQRIPAVSALQQKDHEFQGQPELQRKAFSPSL